jgi:hypothetical protein
MPHQQVVSFGGLLSGEGHELRQAEGRWRPVQRREQVHGPH